MKKLVLVIASIAAASAAFAQKPDTLIVNNPEKVIIEATDSTQTVTVLGKDGNPEYRYTSSLELAAKDANKTETEYNGMGIDFSLFNKNITTKKRENNFALIGLGEMGFGWHAAVNRPAGIQKSSRLLSEFVVRNGMAILYQPEKSPIGVSVGVGYSWQSYYAEAGTMMEKVDGKIVYSNFPANASERSSKLTVDNLLVPLTVYVNVCKDFRIELGPELIINTRSRIRNRYHESPATHKISYKNLPIRPTSYGLFAAVKFFHFTLYARYQPQSVIKEGFGPQFKSFTIGIMAL